MENLILRYGMSKLGKGSFMWVFGEKGRIRNLYRNSKEKVSKNAWVQWKIAAGRGGIKHPQLGKGCWSFLWITFFCDFFCWHLKNIFGYVLEGQKSNKIVMIQNFRNHTNLGQGSHWFQAICIVEAGTENQAIFSLTIF